MRALLLLTLLTCACAKKHAEVPQVTAEDVSGWLKSRMMLKEGRSDADAQRVLDALSRLLSRVEGGRASLEVGRGVATFEARALARRLFEPAPESR